MIKKQEEENTETEEIGQNKISGDKRKRSKERIRRR